MLRHKLIELLLKHIPRKICLLSTKKEFPIGIVKKL